MNLAEAGVAGLLATGKKARWDQPWAAAGSGDGAAAARPVRGSIDTALLIAGTPHLRDDAARAFRSQALADTTKPIYRSHLRTLHRLAGAAGVELLPMTDEKLNIVGGALKAAGYRSTSSYLERYRRAHVEGGGNIDDVLHMAFKGAVRAAVRGRGPVKRAEVFTMESLLGCIDNEGSVVPDGPRFPGRVFAVGTWWLLREVEVSLLRVGQVELLKSDTVAVLDLAITKSDPEGRGFRRSHSCVCSAAARCGFSCPTCVVAAQVRLRLSEGAGAEGLLFPNVAGEAASKLSVVKSMRALLTRDGPGEIDGHSMRRTGAQLLTAAGVEPWLVEWFGRWGSAAIRAYIEDARSKSTQTVLLAEVVCGGPGRAAPSLFLKNVPAVHAPVTPHAVPEVFAAWPPEALTLARASLKDELTAFVVQQLRDEQAKPVFILRLVSGKVHLCAEGLMRAAPARWAALCGWRFGLLPPLAATRSHNRDDCPGSLCKKCHARATRLGWPGMEGITDDSGDSSATSSQALSEVISSGGSNSADDPGGLEQVAGGE